MNERRAVALRSPHDRRQARNRHGSAWPAALLIIGVLLTACDPALGLGGLDQPAPVMGYDAPDFTLQAYNGGMYSLSSFRGRPVLIYFFATWCENCRVELPDIQIAYKTYRSSRKLAVIAINEREGYEEVTQFASHYGLTFPVLMDTEGRLARAYQVNGIPTYFFLDAEGIVRGVSIGALGHDGLYEQLERILPPR